MLAVELTAGSVTPGLFLDDTVDLQRLVGLQRVVRASQERRRLREAREAALQQFLAQEQAAFECLPDDEDDDGNNTPTRVSPAASTVTGSRCVSASSAVSTKLPVGDDDVPREASLDLAKTEGTVHDDEEAEVVAEEQKEDAGSLTLDELLLMEEEARDFYGEEETVDRRTLKYEQRWERWVCDVMPTQHEIIAQRETLGRLQLAECEMEEWDSISKCGDARVPLARPASAAQCSAAAAAAAEETAALADEEGTARRAIVKQERSARDARINAFFLNLDPDAQSDDSNDRAEASVPPGEAEAPASRSSSTVSPPVPRPPISVEVCPPHASEDVLANPFAVDSVEALANCEDVFRDLLIGMEATARDDSPAWEFYSGLQRFLIREESLSRGQLECEEAAQAMKFDTKSAALSRPVAPPSSTSMPSRLSRSSSSSSLSSTSESSSGSTSDSSAPVPPTRAAPPPTVAQPTASLLKRKRFSVMIVPPDAPGDTQPFVAFSLGDVEDFESTSRKHLEEQQLSSIGWMLKDFTETALFVLVKQESKERDFVTYDEALDFQHIAVDDVRECVQVERVLLQRQQERQRALDQPPVPLVLTAATLAKLEKLMKKETAARKKIVTAEKSYMHAFHDEFGADLRRTNSFSLATMMLSMASVAPAASSQKRGSLDDDDNDDDGETQPKAPDASRQTPSAVRPQGDGSLQTKPSFARRGDRKAIFTDELHTPLDLELDGVPPPHTPGNSATATALSPSNSRAPAPEGRGAGGKAKNSFSSNNDDDDEDITAEELAQSATHRPKATSDSQDPTTPSSAKPALRQRHSLFSLVSVSEGDGELRSPRCFSRSQQYCPMPLPAGTSTGSAGFARVGTAGSGSQLSGVAQVVPVPSAQESGTETLSPVSAAAQRAARGPPIQVSIWAMDDTDESAAEFKAALTVGRSSAEMAKAAIAEMKEILCEQYTLQPSKHYRLMLQDFVDAVLIVGMSATMEAFARGIPAGAYGGVQAPPDASEGELAAKLWTHPLLFSTMNELLAGRRYAIDGSLCEKTELVAGAWVYMEDMCAALIHGLTSVHRALYEKADADGSAGGQTPEKQAPAEVEAQTQLHQRKRLPPAKTPSRELPVYEWTMQFITYGLQRLSQDQVLPNRDIAASVFELLASATAHIHPARPAPLREEASENAGGQDEDGFSLTRGRCLPYKLFKNVFWNQISSTKTRIDTLRVRTNLDYGGAAMTEVGVPYLAFSAFLYNSGPKRNTFSLAQMRRTIEPMLQPSEVMDMISPMRGNKLKKRVSVPPPQLPLANLKMLFVLRGTDCIAKLAAVHENLARLQQEYRTCLRAQYPNSLANGNDGRPSAEFSNFQMSRPGGGRNSKDDSDGSLTDAMSPPQEWGYALGKRTSMAQGGGRRQVMHAVRSYFYGILEHAEEKHKHKVAAKCLLLLVLFSTWMEQDEEAKPSVTKGNRSTEADDDRGTGPGARRRALTDRFWTRRIFQAASQYYSFLGKCASDADSGKAPKAEASPPAPTDIDVDDLEDGGDEEAKKVLESARKKTLSPSDKASFDAGEADESADTARALTVITTKIAVLFYDFFLNLRGHRRTNFPQFMKLKYLPTQTDISELQRDIRFYHKQREEDALAGAATSTTVNGNDEERVKMAVAANSSVAALLADGDEGGKWVRTPVDANVPYTEYPEGPESLKRVTETVSKCLNVIWLSYSAELDGVVTFYSANYFEDGPALDLTVFCKTEGDTLEMEHLLEQASLHANNFNTLMDACMTYLQALWSCSRWMRTLASSMFDNPVFAVPFPNATPQPRESPLATSPPAKKKAVGKNPFPKNFDDCSKQLAQCIISTWPYHRKEKSPFHHIPDSVYRRREVDAKAEGGHRANKATKTSSRAPRPGFQRHASLASFASSIRSFNASASNVSAAAGQRTRCNSLTRRSFASLFDDIVVPNADVSMTAFDASTASIGQPPGVNKPAVALNPFQHGKSALPVKGDRTAGTTYRATCFSSPEQTAVEPPTRGEAHGTLATWSRGANDLASHGGSQHTASANRGTVKGGGEPLSAQPPSNPLAPVVHSITPARPIMQRSQKPPAESSDFVRQKCLGTSRILCVAPEPEMRECIEMQSVCAFSRVGSRRTTLDDEDKAGEEVNRPTLGDPVEPLAEMTPEPPSATAVMETQLDPLQPTLATTAPMDARAHGHNANVGTQRSSSRLPPTGRRLKATTAPHPPQESKTKGKAGPAAPAGRKIPRKPPTTSRYVRETFNDLSAGGKKHK